MRKPASGSVGLDRGLTESEQSDLNEWLALSVAHAKAFERQAECWDKTESYRL